LTFAKWPNRTVVQQEVTLLQGGSKK